LEVVDWKFFFQFFVVLEIVASHAAKRVVEAPVGLHGGDVVAACGIFLTDGRIEVEYRVASHDIEPACHKMALLSPLVGKRCHMYFPCLHIELQHQFFHVLMEIPHALLHLGVGQCQLRFCLSHTAFPPPPVEYGQDDGNACRLLAHRTAIGCTDVCPCLRKSELHIEVGFQSCIGACLGKGTLAFLLYPAVIVGVGTVCQCQFHGMLQWHFECRHLAGDFQPYFLRLRQTEERADGLHLLPQFHLSVHHVGFLVQPVDFQLQHLVFRNSSVLVPSLCHLIEGVCRSKVLLCHLQFCLCLCQAEEISTGCG
jgi:hypothetical protein